MPTLYTTGDNSELVASLDISTSSATATRYIIFQLRIPELHIGDIVEVLVDHEVTNDAASGNYTCAYASYVIMSNDPLDTAKANLIVKAAGMNVDHDLMHHLHVSRVGASVVTDARKKYITYVGYAASLLAQPGDQLTVEQNYGRMIVLVHH